MPDTFKSAAAKFATPLLAGLIPFVFVAGNVYGSNAAAVTNLSNKMAEREAAEKEKAAAAKVQDDEQRRLVLADHDLLVRLDERLNAVPKIQADVAELRKLIEARAAPAAKEK